ncbi:MAG: MFS transporter [Anaerolineae bacterium]|nr:MFS transporter [Anaerolineae bacterium]
MFDYLGRNARWLSLSYLLWGVGEGLWIYIQTLYIKELGATPEQIGFVLGLSWLIKLLIYLPVGWLGDRFGPRQVMIPAWVVGTVGVIGIALAPDWRWLVPAFVCYGMSGAAVPLSSAYLSRVVTLEAKERPQQTFSRVVTTLNAGFWVGLIFSPALGGWLAQAIGLRSVFAISAFWFVLSTFAATRTRSLPPVERHADVSGYGELFRRRWLMPVLGTVGLAFAAAALASPTGTAPAQFLEDEHGLASGVIGVLGSLNAVSIALMSIWLGRSEKPLHAFAAAMAFIWAGCGLLLIGQEVAVSGSAYVLLGGGGVARSLLESVIVPRVREGQRGVLLGLLGSVHALGTAAGTGMAGPLYTNPGPQAPFVVALVVLPVTVGLCWAALRSSGQPSAAPRPAAQATYTE